ncbi:hypothetical protein [Tahibacter amnicola]|uniref:Uncharacterized protein n=1 Tax=Tahibacter amnicola TaxID=2976241 RepID=A0ABY6BDZ3_9GAMM|nr:hypothetical protein [Tahibacter amnicola]UXI68025.1 hypothetical protein N4264_25420 [Tahibacter amnicola]
MASGLLGTEAFAGGYPVAALGFVAHYIILIIAAGMYAAASVAVPALRERAIAFGALYGAVIYVVMNDIIVPLSAAPPFRSTLAGVLSGYVIHVLGVGVPIAWTVRRALAPALLRPPGEHPRR